VEPGERSVKQVPPGGGKKLWVRDDLYELKATSEDTGGAYALVENTATPGLPGPLRYIHHNEDEAFYVLGGRSS
jgi:hypothetical protein